jgi:hypothetical protein
MGPTQAFAETSGGMNADIDVWLKYRLRGREEIEKIGLTIDWLL